MFAHPDDESLSAGGALARAASSGARTAVVTTTWSAETARGAELAAALAILKAGSPRFLGYADARVPESAPDAPRLIDADLDEAVGRLVALIRDFRPHSVLTHDPYGGVTGHPDHLQTYRITALAVEAAGLAAAYPAAGRPWRTPFLRLATHPESAMPMLARYLGETRPLLSVRDEQVTDAFDVTPWMESKVAAVLAYKSEVERGAAPGLVASLSSEDRRRLLGTEWFISRRLY